MITLLSEIHFWTTQEDVTIKHTDYGSFKYYSKKDIDETVLAQTKKIYCEQRNILYQPTNKRPQKLKDKFKEFEEYLIHNKIVCFNWEDNKLRLLLSTGLLVHITVSQKTGDVININFDKQLSTKLQVNIICDGKIFGSQVICICNDGHVLGFGGLWTDGWVLEGGPRKRLNCCGEWLAVWGKSSAEHPQPWSPLAKDHQRANIHLYWIGSREPELLTYKKTDGEPLQVVVSKVQNRNLIVVEQKVTQRGSVSVEISNFELIGNNLKRISVTSVPLQTQVSCTAMSHNEERLLIGCIDGSLALLDRYRGSTRTVKAAFIPTLAVWHPLGAVVAISNERGQLQYYDTALNCIKSQILGEDCIPTTILELSSYFNMQFSVASIDWGHKDLILSLEQGPIAVVTHVEKSLSFKAIVRKYLNTGKIEKAIKLLLSWEFNEDSFRVLQMVVAAILRCPLTKENAQFLQNALGSYHNSPVPLSTYIRHKFSGQVLSLTRRFFHQLVRAEMFETAFLLAVDVGHHDLFMDLHYIAVKIGETEMAAAARAQASALLSRCSSEASSCSRSSCSQCSDVESSSSNDDYDIKSVPESSKSEYVPTLPLNTDNLVTTDFSQPDPTTYKPVENASKIDFTARIEQTRLNKATYVKSPQVPATYSKLNFSKTSLNRAPAVLLPNISSLQSDTPNLQHSKSLSHLFSPNPAPNGNNINDGHMNDFSSAFNPVSSICTNSGLKQAGSLINLNSNTSTNFPIASNAGANMKKNQPKVKFSDTVTAFIVPEIKRPVRPPPPPYVTNPQKELADSLPLCHPNEDYLKDFTPIKKDEESEDKPPEQTPAQPKIKVVHFGVV